jgi:putative ABC transport system ATP-binding protein
MQQETKYVIEMGTAEIGEIAAATEEAQRRRPKRGHELLIEARGLCKTYRRGSETLNVLGGLDLEVPRGSFAAIMGPSGSGKSTLLYILAGLDRADSGEIRVADAHLHEMSSGALCDWRARCVGIVFQSFNLLPVLTARENVELPLTLWGLPARERKRRAETALRVVGLSEQQNQYPNQLSGGQQQRVAIARAIVVDPLLIVADEPTGDLDRASAEGVLGLLGRLAHEFGKTIVMVTHDVAAGEVADVVLHVDKGRLA